MSRHRDLYSAQQVREQVVLDVSNSVHQLEEAKLTLAAGKTALDLAQKALVAEQRKYELGAETIFFVLDAQTRLAEAESSLLQAQVGYQIAVAAVDHATGGLLQPYHVQIAELSPNDDFAPRACLANQPAIMAILAIKGGSGSRPRQKLALLTGGAAPSARPQLGFCGSLTLVNQKSVMLSIRLLKPSNCEGLLR